MIANHNGSLDDVSWATIAGIHSSTDLATQMPLWVERLVSDVADCTNDPVLLARGFHPISYLGAGNGADVFLAWSDQHEHLVAIKEATSSSISRNRHQDVVENKIHWEYDALREIHSASGDIAHAPYKRNIITPYELVLGDEKVFLVMSPVISLENVLSDCKISRAKTFSEFTNDTATKEQYHFESLFKRIEAFQKLCRAVQFVHESGYVHRDLKPGNVLVGSDAEPVLIDFGCSSRIADNPLFDESQTIGSLGYMAPEALVPKDPCPRVTLDVYSLGALMYEALTGKMPFHEVSHSVPGLTVATLTREPNDPKAVDPRLPVELISICKKAMAKNVDQRYQTVSELVRDIDRYNDALDQLRVSV